MAPRDASVIKAGTWLYDGQVETPVRILRQTRDEYHEPGYDDDPPDLNEEGHAFIVVYGEPSPPEPGREAAGPRWPSRSHTCLSLEEAVALAERTVGSGITWLPLPRVEGGG